MGIGLTHSNPPDGVAAALADLGRRAHKRNREMVRRINAHLDPVTIDYQRDVLPSPHQATPPSGTWWWPTSGQQSAPWPTRLLSGPARWASTCRGGRADARPAGLAEPDPSAADEAGGHGLY